MRMITIASLGASAGLGLAALFVAKVVLPESQASAATVSAPAPMADAVPMVVARHALTYGTRLAASDLMVIEVPRTARPEGAFDRIDLALAQDKGTAPLVLQPIAGHEPVLPARLSGPGARPSVAAEIAPGFRAYAIRVSDVSGVGGHALPGDRVDVVLMRNLSTDDRRKVLSSEVVLQNIRVLGVDLNADLTSAKPATPNTATLEVAMRDAQKLAMAAELGTLSLALRGSGMAEIAPTTPLDVADVVTGSSPLSQPGHRPVPRRAAPPRPRATILVVEGEGASPSNAS